MKISGNVFIVTGGGSGLGAATGKALAQQGATVVIVDLDVTKGQAVATETGGVFWKTDVSDEASVKEMYAFASGLGKLRGAVNCAGIAPAEKVIGKSGIHALSSFMRTMQINVGGTFNLLRLAADIMASQEPVETGERGVIINTASIAAFDGQIGQAAYAASKGAIVSMTLPLARELAWELPSGRCCLAISAMKSLFPPVPHSSGLARGHRLTTPRAAGTPKTTAPAPAPVAAD
ncbi:SDR family NAD(P)-dependent oxidoreductase [Cupriavidus consociatus]|uniref:SDR family NAD(P)-dependent oxidoreductase n=1 Tax=Cupriavidus consociatus TaxID=2821357 RepID=UPI001FD7507E|nr:MULTISPECIES: SDR family NAD(P)-dependent oxidoreductase [unclassified Cupriavidus]MDK2658986.1 SDR family NAD(P)-dependent oxidoreductase [Cupriavidus sp. LEh21]